MTADIERTIAKFKMAGISLKTKYSKKTGVLELKGISITNSEILDMVISFKSINNGNVKIDSKFIIDLNSYYDYYVYSLKHYTCNVRFDLRDLNFELQDIYTLNSFTNVYTEYGRNAVFVDFSNYEDVWNNFDKAVYNKAQSCLNHMKRNDINGGIASLEYEGIMSLIVSVYQTDLDKAVQRIASMLDTKVWSYSFNNNEIRNSLRDSLRTFQSSLKAKDGIVWEDDDIRHRLYDILGDMAELVKDHNKILDFNNLSGQFHIIYKEYENRALVVLENPVEFLELAKSISEQINELNKLNTKARTHKLDELRLKGLR
jgi:hypothetical protein